MPVPIKIRETLFDAKMSTICVINAVKGKQWMARTTLALQPSCGILLGRHGVPLRAPVLDALNFHQLQHNQPGAWRGQSQSQSQSQRLAAKWDFTSCCQCWSGDKRCKQITNKLDGQNSLLTRTPGCVCVCHMPPQGFALVAKVAF